MPQKRARRLRVNSFLVWNVDEPVLYIQNEEGQPFEIGHRWEPLNIKLRDEVQLREQEWRGRLHQILNDLNDYFARGILRSSLPEAILDATFVTRFLDPLKGPATNSIRHAANVSAKKQASFQTWWYENSREYGQAPSRPIPFESLADIALTGWSNRIVFCHYLKQFHDKAHDIERISGPCSLQEALEIMSSISQTCDFLHIFGEVEGMHDIGQEAWMGLREFNTFLSDLKLQEIPTPALHAILDQMLEGTRRKASGQFVTPVPLASLLVHLTVEDRLSHVLDPCCGTGTIARAAYDLKRAVGLTPQQALSTVWASDKFRFPLQTLHHGFDRSRSRW